MEQPKNVFFQKFEISQETRAIKKGHKSLVIWFTGLSGSGKSTIANALEKKLHELDIDSYTLDGDNLRLGLNKDLSFSLEDRTENLRRVAEVAKLFKDSGQVVLTSFVSPLRLQRDNAKTIIGGKMFYEVFVNTPLEECEKRDVKNLYKKARAGEITDFTGISSPFEAPIHPDIEVNTVEESLNEIVNKILGDVLEKIKL